VILVALMLGCGAPADGPTPQEQVSTLQGEVTWHIDFGPSEEALGRADCSYTRSYSGAEDRSSPWLCLDCDTIWAVDVALDVGRDCYDLIAEGAPPAHELLGLGADRWYRAHQGPLDARGPATRSGDTVTLTDTIPPEDAGGDLTMTITGTLTLGEAPGDPTRGLTPPDSYACGWPQASPSPYDGDWRAAVGEIVPDGVFTDPCGEPMRLHDLAGDWLVIDVSAIDCPPCQAAAAAEPAFTEALAADGIDLHVVTLLAPSLSRVASTPTLEELVAWRDAFGLHDPVLADRAWGLSVFPPDDGGFSYPTLFVVGPDLVVRQVQQGFSSFDAIEATIRGG